MLLVQQSLLTFTQIQKIKNSWSNTKREKAWMIFPVKKYAKLLSFTNLSLKQLSTKRSRNYQEQHRIRSVINDNQLCHFYQLSHLSFILEVYFITQLIQQIAIIDNMESWLKVIRTQVDEQININLKEISSIFSEFSYVFNILDCNHQDAILASKIDDIIKQHMSYLNNINQIILEKLSLKPQNLSCLVNISQPAHQVTNHLEICLNKEANSKGQNTNRRHYRSYNCKQKNQVVQLYIDGMSFYAISKKLGIPYKNVMRWCSKYFSEKEQNQRWVNFKMEKKLWLWLESHPKKEKLLLSDIQRKSLELSTNPQFKASRGWVRNFLKRCQLANKEIHHLSAQLIIEK